MSHYAGNIYAGTSSTKTFVQSSITAINKPVSLLDSQDRIFSRARPQYEDYAPSQFINVRNFAKGDGHTDDTAAIQAAIDEVSKLPLVGGVRGAVLLDKGRFHCSATLRLAIGFKSPAR